MKYLKLYEDLHQPSNSKKKLRLVQLGLSEEGLKVLCVTVHWESLEDFADSKHKDHYVARDPLFTVRAYHNWPVSDESIVWQDSIDDIWSDWKEWFGQEGDSDEIFDHLIDEAKRGGYDLLHLRNEGQFYDPYTREMVGTGSMQKPKLNESANTDLLIPSTEEAIEKFSNWKRLAHLGLAERMALVQIETQSDWMDPNLGFTAHIDTVKFREFKEFLKRLGVVHTNSYAGRSKEDETISAHLWEMPQWSMWAFSKLPELAKSGFAPIKSYKEPTDRIWNSWYSAITSTERVDESNSIYQKLRLFKLGLMDPTEFNINKMSVVVDGPISQLRKGRLTYLTVLKGMYKEIKERAKELGVYLSAFFAHSMRHTDPINHVQFMCMGPVESLNILEPEINAKLSELNQNEEIDINITNHNIVFGSMHTGPEPNLHNNTLFSNWTEWAEANLSDL